ncbi:hypothetical protein D1007_26921 [Hordeum vulgare]|nr:hypothetical protein D1007_26921 [Hordeum vulgare]
MLFESSPSYGDVLEQVRKNLNWMDPSDVVEFEGRHNVGFGMHTRWKTMRVNSDQRSVAYKETVAESLDKALELFASKKVESSLHLDLNRNPSPLVDSTPPPMNQDQMSEPHLTQQVWPTLSPISNNQNEAFQEENDEYEEDDNDVARQLLSCMASSQPNKPTMKGVEDTEGGGEMLGWWEKATKKVREEEAAAREKKKQEEEEEKQKEKWRMIFGL